MFLSAAPVLLFRQRRKYVTKKRDPFGSRFLLHANKQMILRDDRATKLTSSHIQLAGVHL